MSAAQNEQPAAMPETLGGVTPYLTVEGAVKASDFYVKAFGAKEVFRQPVDDKGRTMHVHLYLNGSSLMLTDGYPEYGCGWEKPQGFNLALQVKDIDTWFNRAVEAGCTVVMAPQDMFWGARYAQVRDPFGILWAMNEPK